MIRRIGLVSVTFRALSPERVVEAAVEAGLQGIEWGGDIHVPHGDLATARRVRRLTEEAGLQVVSYGSYYKAGTRSDPCFEDVLETAAVLGAPGIRVWAGRSGSAECPAPERREVAEDLSRIVGMAQTRGIGVSLEFHGGTLTDTAASAVSLVREVGKVSPSLYWQPVTGRTTEENQADLETVAPYLSNLHVFHWSAGERYPFAQGVEPWSRYLHILHAAEWAGWLLFEFVREDRPDQLIEDSRALKRLLEKLP